MMIIIVLENWNEKETALSVINYFSPRNSLLDWNKERGNKKTILPLKICVHIYILCIDLWDEKENKLICNGKFDILALVYRSCK